MEKSNLKIEKAKRRYRDLIAKKIREFRQTRNISQEEFAEMTGMHRTYVGVIERAEKGVRLDTLVVIAFAMDVNVSDLLSEELQKGNQFD